MVLKAIRPIICVLLTLACFGMPVDFVSATSGPFRVIEHTVAVVLNEKGQAVVTEEICLETLSEVRNFSLDRQMAQDQKMTINKIAVSDSDAEAENRRMIELMPTDLSTDQAKAMTYQVNLDKRLTSIDMHLFLKSDTKRLIQVSYTIDAAVQNHLDASFYQQRFFEIRDLIEPIGSATVRVSCSIPYAADKSWFLASSLTSFMAIETDDNSLYLKAEPLPASHELQLSLIMPTGAFPMAPPASDMKSSEQLKSGVLRADEQMKRRNLLKSMVFSVVFILIGLAAVITFLLYWFFDREGYWPDKEKYLREAPHACPPFLLTLLLRKRQTSQIILGMLMTFVDLGILELDGTVFSQTEKANDLLGTLSESETFLYHWFFKELASGNALALADVRGYARHSETAHTFRRRYGELQRLLSLELGRHELIDPERTHKGQLAAFITAAGYGLLAVVLFVLLKSPTVWLLLIVTAGLLLYSLTIRRLTNRGRERLMEARALVRYLRRLKQVIPYPDDDRQRMLFPYAVALGLTDTYIQQLQNIWQEKPLKDQFTCYGISPESTTPLSSQTRQLMNDIRVMENILSSSVLLPEMIRRSDH